MHTYSIDTEIRKHAIASIVVVSILIVWLVSIIPTFTVLNVSISASVSLGLIFGLIWILFDYFWWKKLAKYGFLVDLNGAWEGLGKSSYIDPDTGKNVEYKIDVLIKQTFSKIEISLSTKKSSSKSTMAAIYMNHTMPRVVYSYENKPFVDVDPDMGRHTGLQELTITNNKLSGEYFSGNHRVSTGMINLSKKDATV